MDAHRNLLFGVLVLQGDIIDADRFAGSIECLPRSMGFAEAWGTQRADSMNRRLECELLSDRRALGAGCATPHRSPRAAKEAERVAPQDERLVTGRQVEQADLV